MKKEFDFDEIGKQTPYRVPEDFFEEVQQKVMVRTGCRYRQKRRIRMVISATLAAAAVVTGLLFFPFSSQTQSTKAPASSALAVEAKANTTDPMDKWINELSDEELEELVNFSENDIFLN